MAEYAPQAVRDLFAVVDANIHAAVNSGIVGNAAHTTGYHRSRNRLLATGHTGDYSIQAAADKVGDGDAVAALDVSLPPAEMRLVTHRVVDACEAKDPRVDALREVIGTFDGRNVCGYNRVATGSGSRSKVGFVASGFADSSHLWHCHFSVFRGAATDSAACKAIGAVAAGLPLPAPVPLPKIVIGGKEYDDLTSVSVAGVNLARDLGAFSRHVWYVQEWLRGTGDETNLGYWDAVDQAMFNTFRRDVLRWTGDDVTGSVGVTSLSALATHAGSTKPVRP